MCTDCGCQEGNERKLNEINGHKHDHDHSHHHHHHDHEHSHDHVHEVKSKVLEIETKVLAKNDGIAEENRKLLKEKGIVTINFISSPGSGKTTLLQETLKRLKGKVECSVIVGDQSTDNDAQRLKEHCDKVIQIETNSSCHITAEQVALALPEVIDDSTKVLFIENVGNLICPAAFDLGEDFRVAVLSTTEGEDKPIKYPVIFSDAEVILLTKIDLIPYLNWDLLKCREYINQINHSAKYFELSSTSGDGMSDWIEYLSSL